MCGWNKATANRRQAESRVKLAWLCRGAKEEDEVNRRQAESRVKLAWLCRGTKEEDEVNRRHTGRHELFPMAGAGGGRQSQSTDNKWTYGESQHERYCQI